MEVGPAVGRADGADDGAHVGVIDRVEEGFGVEY